MKSHEIIRRPIVTEKSTGMRETANVIAFEVNPAANKIDVKRAVEELFSVKVDKVRTQNRRGKHRKYKFKQGQTKSWKKAVVTLDEEHRIDFF